MPRDEEMVEILLRVKAGTSTFDNAAILVSMIGAFLDMAGQNERAMQLHEAVISIEELPAATDAAVRFAQRSDDKASEHQRRAHGCDRRLN